MEPYREQASCINCGNEFTFGGDAAFFQDGHRSKRFSSTSVFLDPDEHVHFLVQRPEDEISVSVEGRLVSLSSDSARRCAPVEGR